MPSRGKRKRGRIRKRSDAFGRIRKREPFPQSHEKGEARKNSVARMGGFCVCGIKKYPSEGVKCLEGGELFR